MANFFFLEDDWTTSYSLCFYTDVAQSIGYGLIFGKQWAYRTWLDSWTDHHISVRNFFQKHSHVTGPAFYDTAHGSDFFPAEAIRAATVMLQS